MDRLREMPPGILILLMVFCYASTTAAAGDSSFKCPGSGTYADPNNCHNYYVCDSNLVATSGTCMDGAGSFDPDTQSCDDEPCDEVPAVSATDFKCPSVGLHADPSNCHNYYSCDQDLNPIPGTCLQGRGSFDPVNRTCSADPCPITAAPDPTEFSCPSAGFFADPSNCHAYYTCDSKLIAHRGTCTKHGVFHPRYICRLNIGMCDDPDEDTSLTTAAPKPLTGNYNFQCTSQGYYEDPEDCRGFYHCNKYLEVKHGICYGGGGYFNATLRGCIHGHCLTGA